MKNLIYISKYTFSQISRIRLRREKKRDLFFFFKFSAIKTLHLFTYYVYFTLTQLSSSQLGFLSKIFHYYIQNLTSFPNIFYWLDISKLWKFFNFCYCNRRVISLKIYLIEQKIYFTCQGILNQKGKQTPPDIR